MRDIKTRADIDSVPRVFYAHACDDDALLRHVFIGIAHMDLKEHLPVMGSFWEKVLFNTGVYKKNAMRVHRRPRQGVAHNSRWRANRQAHQSEVVAHAASTRKPHGPPFVGVVASRARRRALSSSTLPII